MNYLSIKLKEKTKRKDKKKRSKVMVETFGIVIFVSFVVIVSILLICCFIPNNEKIQPHPITGENHSQEPTTQMVMNEENENCADIPHIHQGYRMPGLLSASKISIDVSIYGEKLYSQSKEGHCV